MDIINNKLKFLDPLDGELSHCMISGNEEIEEIINLGDQPLCDSLLTNLNVDKKKEKFYPLRLKANYDLGCSQLSFIVPGEEVYHADYPYRPGITNEIVQHHTTQASENIKKYNIDKNNLIVDIGSNDGTLLKQYKLKGVKVIGVEPTNIADIANNDGIETIKKPFNEVVADEIKLIHGQAKLITATNVFAHMSQLGQVLRGIKNLLSDDGVFILENHYMVDILKENQYDTIYHEHIRNYSLKSIIYLFSLINMKVIHAEVLQRYQGSIKVVVSKNNKAIVDETISKILKNEEEFGLYLPQVWKDFRIRVEKTKKDILEILNDIKKEGKTVVGNSCPGRCSTLLNYCGINKDLIPYIAEQSTSLKLNKFLPGMHIPIVDNKILSEEQPDYILLLAWHLKEPIIKYLRERGVKSSFITPLPEVEIIN